MWLARTNSLSISLQASSELVTDRVKINSASLPENRNLIDHDWFEFIISCAYYFKKAYNLLAAHRMNPRFPQSWILLHSYLGENF